jgi:hypothetical protein
MGSGLLGRAEQLINIALAITDVDALSWIIQQPCGLPEIFQPPNAFLLFDRNACGVDLPLERRGSFKLVTSPELHRRQSQRQSVGRDCEA